MSKNQLFALFVCSLVFWTIGNGLLPLLPVYAIQLGADTIASGNYLSFSYVALAIGNILAGWISDKLQRRKVLLIVTGIAIIPTIWLMGQATSVWELTALTATTWFFIGTGQTLISILTGLFAGETERGKIFGILSLTAGFGSMLGGLTTGPIVDQWGYPAMFVILAFFSSLLSLTALFLQDKVVSPIPSSESSTAGKRSGLGTTFYFFLLATIATALALFVGRLGTSIAMNKLIFSSAAISSTIAIGGAATLPLSPLIGWLSDRIGRKRLLTICYLTCSLGLLVLAWSTSLWQFWVSASLLSIFAYSSFAVGSALVTDLVPQESLGRGISLFGTSAWIGAIVGLTGAGYAIQNLGLISAFIIGAFLPVIATILLIPIRRVSEE